MQSNPILKFTFNSRVKTIEESGKQTFIEGCLISEGISENGNNYTFSSLRTIAQSAVQPVGKPIYYGVDEKNRHVKGEPIGRIIKTWFNKRYGRVYFRALITSKKIAETIKEGFGISIGGTASAKNVIDSFGRIAQKIFSVVIEHIQLLRPETHRGVQSATVTKIVNETMMFKNYANSNQVLDRDSMFLLILALQKSGDLDD